MNFIVVLLLMITILGTVIVFLITKFKKKTNKFQQKTDSSIPTQRQNEIKSNIIDDYKKINISSIPTREQKSPSPYIKGREGEIYIAQLLESYQKPNEYILNSLKFKYNSINTCQIDHIIVNTSGIWVIETKNYNGYIYGKEEDDKWTQVLGYGKWKNLFDNPIKQNAKHIAQLANYLESDKIFHNIIVFLEEANIEKVNATGVYSAKNLIYALHLHRQINPILSVTEVEYYFKMLLHLKHHKSTIAKPNLVKPKSLQQEQTQNRKFISQNFYTPTFKTLTDAKMQNNQHICPKCGGQTVLRNSKFGAFYGCTNYPNCDYTQKCICPQCKSNLVLRNKNGHFLGCSNYPKCSYTQKVLYTTK